MRCIVLGFAHTSNFSLCFGHLYKLPVFAAGNYILPFSLITLCSGPLWGTCQCEHSIFDLVMLTSLKFFANFWPPKYKLNSNLGHSTVLVNLGALSLCNCYTTQDLELWLNWKLKTGNILTLLTSLVSLYINCNEFKNFCSQGFELFCGGKRTSKAWINGAWL